MNYVDLFAIILIGGFVTSGLYFGLIHTLGSLVGTVISIVITSRLFVPIAEQLNFLFGGNDLVAKIIVFTILFIVISRLVGLVFWILDKTVGVIFKLPFISTISKLAGGILGFIEGVFVVGAILYVLVRLGFEGSFMETIEASFMVKYLLGVVEVFAVLFPVWLSQINWPETIPLPGDINIPVESLMENVDLPIDGIVEEISQ